MTFEEIRTKTIDTFRHKMKLAQDEVDLIDSGCMAIPIYYQIRGQSHGRIYRSLYLQIRRRTE